MNILVAFYSRTGRTKAVAEEMARVFESKKHSVKLHSITPAQILKAQDYCKNGKGIELVKPVLDLSGFDLILLGTPVWGFCPSPILLSYLRQLKMVRGKPFAIFSTCTVLPGTTVKRISNILATKNARVLDSINVKSIFEFDKAKLLQARQFAEKLASASLAVL